MQIFSILVIFQPIFLSKEGVTPENLDPGFQAAAAAALAAVAA